MRTKRKDNANFVITRGNDYIVVEQSAIIVGTWPRANCQRERYVFKYLLSFDLLIQINSMGLRAAGR